MNKKSLSSLVLSLALVILAPGCTTVGQAKKLNPETGRINTAAYIKTNVQVLKSSEMDLGQHRDLILVLGGDFFKEQTELTGYFKRVVNRQDMERLLIAEGMENLVSDVTNFLSWKKINDNFGKFLVLKPDFRDEGRVRIFQLKVIDPSNAQDLFIAEIKSDLFWGVSDDTVFYPLYNAFLDWMESTTGEKPKT